MTYIKKLEFIILGMKKYLLRTVKLISLLLIVSLFTLFLQNFVLCHIDHNKLRIDGFYLEDENSLDVVLTGASELYTGFSPGLAYEKFGFTSYPYATASVTAGAALTPIPMTVTSTTREVSESTLTPFRLVKINLNISTGSIPKIKRNMFFRS